MRIGIVSPYPWDVPGGVVQHIHDLTLALRKAGHDARVASPVDDEETPLPPWVTRMGRSVPVPYNGAVSRLLIGPLSASRIRRWLRDGDFDVLHLHSPETFSLSLLTLMNASGPIVATFHAFAPRSRILAAFHSPLQWQMEKLSGRIAVSPAARATLVEHLGADAVLVPNGVDVGRFAGVSPLPRPDGAEVVGFLGRLDEPRKGLAVLLTAAEELVRRRPALRIWVAGPGDIDNVAHYLSPELRSRLDLMGRIDDETKSRMLASLDVYVAPNTGAESFGIVLLEAMAAGAPIVASGLDPFRRVLLAGGEGEAAALLPAPEDPVAFAAAISRLLDDRELAARQVETARRMVQRYDWSVVSVEVVRVYETAIAMSSGRHVSESPEEATLPDPA